MGGVGLSVEERGRVKWRWVEWEGEREGKMRGWVEIDGGGGGEGG